MKQSTNRLLHVSPQYLSLTVQLTREVAALQGPEAHMPPDITRELYTAWSQQLYLIFMNYVVDINEPAARRVVNAAREDSTVGRSIYNMILFCRKQHECVTYQDAKEIDNAILVETIKFSEPKHCHK